MGINRLIHAVQEGRPYADTTGVQNEIASLQSPFQDRPLAFLPRWFNFQTLTGSSFNSPFYETIHLPLTRQYNLGVQWEFARQFVLDIGYVVEASKSRVDKITRPVLFGDRGRPLV